jgi:hypothetical protein
MSPLAPDNSFKQTAGMVRGTIARYAAAVAPLRR